MERHGRERESSPLSFLQALQKGNKHKPMEDKALGCEGVLVWVLESSPWEKQIQHGPLGRRQAYPPCPQKGNAELLFLRADLRCSPSLSGFSISCQLLDNGACLFVTGSGTWPALSLNRSKYRSPATAREMEWLFSSVTQKGDSGRSLNL